MNPGNSVPVGVSTLDCYPEQMFVAREEKRMNIGFLIPYSTFAITVGTLLIWGFLAKRKYKQAHGGSGDTRPRKAA